MSNSSKTIYYFSFYLFVLSLVLILVPNFLLKTFMLPPTEEVWIRVVGMLVFFLGVLYYFSAKQELHGIYKYMAYNRIGVLIFFIVFVAIGWSLWPLILFGLIDAAAGFWTLLALKEEGR
ncbi:MAG: hypothetical protein IT258_19135 [Saprospiraceae bacterium]|nr:hypothetical protein [Saprospiraceae bacterium]